MLFRKKPKKEKPAAVFSYTQAEHYRGFKRIKLSSYGHEPAMNGIKTLADADLSGSVITVSIYGGEYPRAVVSVGSHELGTVWDRYDAFDALRSGKVAAVRVDIRDGDAYLFYKV